MPAVVDAIGALDPVSALASYPGPVWLVDGSRDGFRADEAGFLGACRQGSLTILPRRGHITCLADPRTIADIVTRATAA